RGQLWTHIGGQLWTPFDIVAKAWKPVAAVFTRGGRAADAELTEFRKELKELLEAINLSSLEAQTAVRGSPNEPAARAAYEAAVRHSTSVGQQFACLFDVGGVSPQVPAQLLQARRRYRMTVTDEANLDLTDPKERELQCAEIESSCADFHGAIRDFALKNWGVGLGAKTGRQRGRNFPD
ncbi:hypothetical protein, partial [Caulobacter sp. CCH9-E1]|uniref:hypothetical protein n=1 Tax=Caulobacter sp. CCH9-E1 TaxID=1768768 RepID=UPI001E488334